MPGLTGAFVSHFGDGLRGVALPLLAARLSPDPHVLALVTAAGFLPWVLFALPAGVLVDRVDRVRLLWAVDAFRAVLVGAFALAVLGGVASIPLLAVLAFGLATGQTLFETASQSLVPSLVGPGDLTRANSRLAAGELVAGHFTGPALGAVLLTRAAAAPFVIDAVSFGASAVILSSLPARVPSPPATGGQGTQARGAAGKLRQGLAWLRTDRVLLFVCVYFTAWNFALAGTTAVLVLWARGPLGLSEAQFGLLFLAPAVGGLVGTLAAPRLRERMGDGPGLVASMVGLALAFAGLGVAWHPVVAAVFLALDGAMAGVWNVLAVGLRQSRVPDQLLGRVTSSYRFFGRGIRPVGALAGGLVAGAFGLRAPFLLAAAGLLGATLLALPALRSLAPAEPARRLPGSEPARS
ncbi:MAG: MFS transporter [Acidimicrobiia bacterium]